MPLMTSMRERMHFVLWTLLVMFLLSMTIGGLVGGANIIDQIFGRVNPADAIGVIDGKHITPDEFIRAVNFRIEQIRTDGQEPNEQQLHDIRNEVWEKLVQDILIMNKIDELGLTSTDEEVLNFLKINPPQFLIQDPTFITDGVFDRTKYLQAVNNPQGNEWVEIEQFMKNTYIPNYKLQQYIASSVVVTFDDVQNQYIKDNIEYTVEGIHIIGQKQQGEIDEILDEELRIAYEADLDRFAKEETRNIRYVSWKKAPTQSDSARVFEEAQEIIKEAKSGLDFTKLANQFTEDPRNQVTPDSGRGGKIGWIKRGQMGPAFKALEDLAFETEKGEVVGPVLSPEGYHVLKVNNKRLNDDKEEVAFAHILLNIKMGSQTREKLRRQATRFSYDAQDYGFEAALDSHKVTSQKAKNLQALSISILGVGFLRDVVQFAFSENSDINSVSDRLENDNFFVVAVLDSIIPAGTKSFEEVKAEVRRLTTIEKQKSAAFDLANEVKSKIDGGASLTDLVSDDSRLELVAKDKKKLGRGFNSIGRSYAVIGALLNSEVGDVIGPLETARGYSIVRLLGVAPFDSTDYQSKELDIYSSLTNNEQQAAYDSWIAELTASADIIDNRKYYY